MFEIFSWSQGIQHVKNKMNANYGHRPLQFIVAKDYNITKVMELGQSGHYIPHCVGGSRHKTEEVIQVYTLYYINGEIHHI